MINKKSEKVRQAVLNEIVATLEFIEYLRTEAKGSVKRILKREEKKKQELVMKLKMIELE